MDIDAKIQKLEADIRMKTNQLFVELTPPENDIVHKTSLRESIRVMEHELNLLKSLRDSSDE
jgi:hypothetical protein